MQKDFPRIFGVRVIQQQAELRNHTMNITKSLEQPSTEVDKIGAAAAATAAAPDHKPKDELKIEVDENGPDQSERNPDKEQKAAFPRGPTTSKLVGVNIAGHSVTSTDIAPRVSLDENNKELLRHEEIITRGLNTFAEVGASLGQIRDKKLYELLGFESFDAYLDARWHFTKQRASQLIKAADTRKILIERVDEGKLPKTERAMRELIKVPDDKRAEVLNAVAAQGEATAERIVEIKATILPKKEKKGKEVVKKRIKFETALKSLQHFVAYIETCTTKSLQDDQREALKAGIAKVTKAATKLELQSV